MKKTYWKEWRRTLTGSLGRFLSITLLMLLGSFVLVGLKATVPDMTDTADSYFKTYQPADLMVMADYGLSQDDQKELKAVKGAKVEWGYMTDTTVKDSTDALRIFSYQSSDQISQYEVTSGRLPKNKTEIAVADFLAKKYKIGDKLELETGDDSPLVEKTFTITGFVNSSEILSTSYLGISSSGSGRLAGYAVTQPQAFSSEVYGIARLRYANLASVSAFSPTYTKRLAQHERNLKDVLADNGQNRWDDLQEAGQDKLKPAKDQLQAAKEQLVTARQQFEQASATLPEAAKAAAQADLTKAEQDIKDNEAKLAEQEEKLKELKKPNYQVFNRSTIPGGSAGYDVYKNSLSSVEMISNIFPAVLYAVAAMVSLTTMTRFVDEERLKSGIFKALGYDNPHIIHRFVVYGLVSSLLGTSLGAILGTYFLPQMIAKTIMTNITWEAVQLKVHWLTILWAFFLALLSSVVPAYLVAKRDLSEKPAQLLQAKPPVKGEKILLERLSFIWNRMSFISKVTARNIFRYKQRMLMTIFGVAGSVTLLFAGLGIQSSVGSVVDKQFGQRLVYDMIVTEKDGATKEQKEELLSKLRETAKMNQGIYYESTDQSIEGIASSQPVTMMVAKGKDFGREIQLVDLKDKDVTLSDKGVLISEKLASFYGVKEGDQFDFETADGKMVKLRVDRITRLYAGHFVFMNQAYYEKTFKQDFETNAYLITAKSKGRARHDQLAADLLELDGVANVIQNTDLIRTVDSVVDSLDKVMLILVVVSVLLASVILYNLTTINVAERLRELSTIKVLGFFNKEVTFYIYRETIVLSLIGIILGLYGGSLFHRFIIDRIGADHIIFEQAVSSHVYWIPMMTIVSLLLILGFLVNHLLKKVDMLEALKSVD